MIESKLLFINCKVKSISFENEKPTNNLIKVINKRLLLLLMVME
jgi:hypothetical protein